MKAWEAKAYARGFPLDELTLESDQWGYGPTELIGTIQTDNSEFLIGAGPSQSYTMNYWQEGCYYNGYNYGQSGF